MQAVNIAELKNNLSSYLETVRRGEEIVIRDRNRAIARIVPIDNLNDYAAEEAELIASGILRLPENEELPASFLKKKLTPVKIGRVAKVIRDERDED